MRTRPLFSNLKFIYQRLSLWLWYSYLLLLSYLMVFHRRAPKSGYILVSLLAAILVADLQKEVMAKPFSFLLPHHNRIRRRLIFGIGGVLNLLLGMAAFNIHDPHFAFLLLAAIFMGMLFYSLGVWLVFSLKIPTVSWFWIIFMLPVVFRDVFDFLTRVIIAAPLSIAAIGALSCALFWKWMGNSTLSRKFCGEETITAGDTFDYRRIRAYRQRRANRSWMRRVFAVSEDFEKNILAWIHTQDPSSSGRYLLGNFYALFGRAFNLWFAGYFFIMAAAMMLFGYLAIGPNPIIFFFIPALSLLHLDLIPHRSLLLPGGRPEKFYSVLMWGFGLIALSGLGIAGLSAATKQLAPMMPEIAFQGERFVYQPIEIKYTYITLISTPLALALGTLFSRKKMTRIVFIIIMMGVMFIFQFRSDVSPVFLPGTWLGKLSIVAGAGSAFAAAFFYYFRKRDLVEQTK